MRQPEDLAGLLDTREERARVVGDVNQFARIADRGTSVTIATRAGIGFAEIGQERDATAIIRFGVVDQGVKACLASGAF